MFFWLMVLLLPAIFFWGSVFLRRPWKWYWKMLAALGILLLAVKDFFFLHCTAPFYPHAAPPRWLGIVLGLLLAVVELSLLPLAVKELCGLAARRLHKKFPDAKVTLAILVAVFLLSLIGIWNGLRQPRIRELELTFARLPESWNGTRVVFITDLHAGTLHDRDFVEKVVRKVEALQPDLILLGGDVVDQKTYLGTSVVEPLSRLQAPLGIYAVAGNHEYFGGLETWRVFYRESRIVLLENENRRLTRGNDAVYVAGVADPEGKRRHEVADDQPAALAGIPKGSFTIELIHRPRLVEESARAGVDLQLSGHTHGGIIPGLAWYVGKVHQGYLTGLYHVGSMQLYVSPGTGIVSGIPLRLKETPEIALITLKRQKAAPIQRP